MKNLFRGSALVLIILSASLPATAQREVFVSPQGDDQQAGSINAPLRSLGRAAQLLEPGDTCTIRQGTYRECVRPPRSGTIKKPIIYRAYEGESVYIAGSEPLAGWQTVNQSIYAAASYGGSDQLFLDGQMMTLARWPNAPLGPMQTTWANAETGSSGGDIKVSHFPAVAFNHAWIKLLPGSEWCAWTRPLTTCPTGTLCFQVDGSLKRGFLRIGPGTPYYVAGAPGLLDSPGEWCYEPEKRRILLMTPRRDNPALHRVEIKTRDLGFDLSNLSYVQLEGLRFFACTVDLTESHGCNLNKCHLRFPSHFDQCEGWDPGYKKATGLIVSGSGNRITSCSVEWSAGNGISLAGSDNLVSNCLVRYVDYAAVNLAAISMTGERNIVEHCSLSDSGRFGIYHHQLKEGRILYNDVSRAGLITSDCGVTYCWGEDGAGTEIAWNWIHDNQAHLGSGIYLDNGSSNMRVHHNVSWGNRNAGLCLNTPSRFNLVAYNTILGNARALVYFSPIKSVDFTGTKLVNNILVGEINAGPATLTNNFQGADPMLEAPAGWTPISEEMALIRQQIPKDRLADPNAPSFSPTPRKSWNFRPRNDSPCRGKAEDVSGLEPSGPDLGAYMAEVLPWIPGHDWGEPPRFDDL